MRSSDLRVGLGRAGHLCPLPNTKAVQSKPPVEMNMPPPLDMPPTSRCPDQLGKARHSFHRALKFAPDVGGILSVLPLVDAPPPQQVAVSQLEISGQIYYFLLLLSWFG